MSAPLITFLTALLGLSLLFTLKILEERGMWGTTLARFRTFGDPLVLRSIMWIERLLHHTGRERAAKAYRWCRGALRNAERFSVATMQRATAHLHETLLRRHSTLSRNAERVSPHLKNVLESTRNAERTQTDADST